MHKAQRKKSYRSSLSTYDVTVIAYPGCSATYARNPYTVEWCPVGHNLWLSIRPLCPILRGHQTSQCGCRGCIRLRTKKRKKRLSEIFLLKARRHSLYTTNSGRALKAMKSPLELMKTNRVDDVGLTIAACVVCYNIKSTTSDADDDDGNDDDGYTANNDEESPNWRCNFVALKRIVLWQDSVHAITEDLTKGQCTKHNHNTAFTKGLSTPVQKRRSTILVSEFQKTINSTLHKCKPFVTCDTEISKTYSSTLAVRCLENLLQNWHNLFSRPGDVNLYTAYMVQMQFKCTLFEETWINYASVVLLHSHKHVENFYLVDAMITSAVRRHSRSQCLPSQLCLTEQDRKQLPHLLHSLYLFPSDFRLFPLLKGHQLGTVGHLIRVTTGHFREVPFQPISCTGIQNYSNQRTIHSYKNPTVGETQNIHKTLTLNLRQTNRL